MKKLSFISNIFFEVIMICLIVGLLCTAVFAFNIKDGKNNEKTEETTESESDTLKMENFVEDFEVVEDFEEIRINVNDSKAQKTEIEYVSLEIPISLDSSSNDICETTDIEELLKLVQENEENKESAHNMAEAARELEYNEDNPIILIAKQEWANADFLVSYYTNKIEQVMDSFITDSTIEYGYAKYVWWYFRLKGYNEYICSGILGNIMVECGGLSLNINYSVDTGNGYYGMCQWNKNYYSSIVGGDLKRQCKFLEETIKEEFDTFGEIYKKGFDYSSFLELKNEEEVALAFAKCYERCSNNEYNYNCRKKCAVEAHKFFVG